MLLQNPKADHYNQERDTNEIIMELNKYTPLTEKQRKFCEEYSIDLNATQAAIRAGYSEKTAYSIGSRLLKNVEVQKYISEIQGDLEKASGITKLKVLNGFAEMAFSNISRLHNTWIERKDFNQIPDIDKAAIQEISSKIIKRNLGSNENPVLADVEFIKIKLYDRLTALSKISELLGYFKPAKLDLSFIDRLTEEQAEEIINRAVEAMQNGKDN